MNSSEAVHTLPIEELRRYPLWRSRPPEPVIVAADSEYYQYLAWTAEVLHGPNMRNGPTSDRAISHALTALFRIATLPLVFEPLKPGERARDRPPQTRAEMLLTHIMSETLTLGLLAFPILEAIVRWYCSEFIDQEGNALVDLSLRGNFRIKKGNPLTLGPLLRLFAERILPGREDRLEECLKGIGQIMEDEWARGDFSGYDWISLLSSWRNDLLHGRETWLPWAVVFVLNIICTFLWHEFPKAEYEKYQPIILLGAKKMYSSSSPWSFYLPEEK